MKDYHFYYFQYPTMVHAIIGVIGDPLILYFGGFRYNQPNHLSHMFLMVHSMAYFAYDTIIEIYYKTDDMLTNFHHFFVLFGSFFHVRNTYSGYEYILMHLVAELSNPFIIVRTMLKIMNKKDSPLYAACEVLFAAVFILMRLVVTPFLLIAIYEGDNVIYSTKMCISFVQFIQLFWGYRVLLMVFDKVKSIYESKGKIMPYGYMMIHNFIKSLLTNRKVSLPFNTMMFILSCIAPQLYYGLVRKTLFNNY